MEIIENLIVLLKYNRTYKELLKNYIINIRYYY